jgi:hypothetical protein
MIQGNFGIYFRAKLEELKLRSVEKYEWKLESNVDEKGYTKCVELDGFKFVYIDPSGKVHDLRPKASMPSYNNFMKKDEKELYKLLIEAYENQIKAIESGEKYSTQVDEVLSNLKEELKEACQNYKRLS